MIPGMAGSRRKKDAAYAALQSLMEEPGSDRVILEDFLTSIETDLEKKIARLMAGTKPFDDRGVAVVFGSLVGVQSVKFTSKEAPIAQKARQKFTLCVAFSVLFFRGEDHWPKPRTWKNNAAYVAMYGKQP